MKEERFNLGIFKQNEFFDNYVKLIQDNKDREYAKFSTLRHHIIPVSYFVTNCLSVDNSDENIVNLLYVDHVLAHYYLSQCTIEPYCYHNSFAFVGMSSRLQIDQDSLFDFTKLEKYQAVYEQARRRMSELMTGRPSPFKGMKGRGQGHEVSDETRKKISDKAKGRYLNHVYLYKGDKEIRVPMGDVYDRICEGYEIGRCEKTKQALRDGYNYESKGMLGKHQSAYLKLRAREAASLPRTELSRKHLSEVLRAHRASGKYTYMRNPQNIGTARVNPENVLEYLNKGFTFCKTQVNQKTE